MHSRLLPIATLGAALLIAPPALADTATDAQTSANWAGYAATGAQFSQVSGDWVQPTASCDGSSGDAVFWVGIGGATEESSALEQTGTEVDCSSGSPVYSAWYELVPAAPVKVDLAVQPGDHIAASVGVDGDQVSIALTDQTTGKRFSRTLQMENPDTSSAEWIAEAPSVCQGSTAGDCQPVALADFDSVSFTNATATAGGQTGTAAQWSAQAMQLSGSEGGGNAAPSTLDRGSFSVAWQSADSAQGGYGDGSGYGYGGSSGYGDGSGYGYGDGSTYGDGSGYGYGDGSGLGGDYGYGDGGYGAYGDYGLGF